MLIVLVLTVLSSCKHPTKQKDIVYTIPYLKFDSNDFSLLKKWKGNQNPIKLYADQYGKNSDETDLSANFKVGWSDKGLMIFCQVIDNLCYIDTLNPLKSDALEILLAPFRGSTDIIQLTVLPINSPIPSGSTIYMKSFRTTASIEKITVDAVAYSKRTGNTNVFNVLIPLECLGISPEINKSILMQLNIYDSDDENTIHKNILQWSSIGGNSSNSFAMGTLLFTKRGELFPDGTSKCYITDNKVLTVIIYKNTLKRSKVIINRNSSILLSADTVKNFPWTLNFPLNSLNPDNDTIRVFINNELISIHDLFNVPRIYDKINSPGGYENEIRFFEAQDRLNFPPPNATVFVGSSSIKGWDNIKDYFPGKEIIQRGFGGSMASDVLIYINRIVLPYKPSSIVYYEGDNDIAKGFSQEEIISNMDSFINIVHKNLPETKVYILTPKPSFARFHLLNKYINLNKAICNLCNKYLFASCIDVASPMFDEKGNLRKDIFIEDGLHLNEKGYKIWGETIFKRIDLK